MIRSILIGVLGLIIVVAGIAGLLLSGSQEDVVAERPDIPFAPLSDESLKDPDNPAKIFRVDMARVEHDYPLSRADLMTLTPART